MVLVRPPKFGLSCQLGEIKLKKMNVSGRETLFLKKLPQQHHFLGWKRVNCQVSIDQSVYVTENGYITLRP